MAKVAVVLSGCGVYDGAEINEAVLTLLNLEQQGASYQCFAPDIDQLHVINHLTGEPVEGESRNVMVEAARIARGNVLDLAGASADDYDALVVPGGFGAAKNLCNFAVAGADMEIQPDFLRVAQAFHRAGKPIGLICIAPVMAAAICGEGTQCTIGNDADTAAAMLDFQNNRGMAVDGIAGPGVVAELRFVGRASRKTGREAESSGRSVSAAGRG